MKIFITTAIWGSKYVDIFLQYSLASLLSKNNIPQLSYLHEITIHLITTKFDYKRLQNIKSFKVIIDFNVNIIFSFIEDITGNEKPATGYTVKKYKFLTNLQNYAIKMSDDYDVIIFNYADFVWGDNSLNNIILKIDDGHEAVLGFCMPVDLVKCADKLDSFIDEHGSLSVDNLTASKISISAMHREAMLRYWDAPLFSITPTYLMWKVNDGQGVLLRAYHQTIFALKTDFLKHNFDENIKSSLDGYYSSLVVENSNFFVATSSDTICIFSLYDTIIDSRLIAGKTKFDSLSECLKSVVSESNRKLAIDYPIMIKTSNSYNQKIWDDVKYDSEISLSELHNKITFNKIQHKELYTSDLEEDVSNTNIYLVNKFKTLLIFFGLSNILILSKIRYLMKIKKNKFRSFPLSFLLFKFFNYLNKIKFLNIYSELVISNWLKNLYHYIYIRFPIESKIDSYFANKIINELSILLKNGDIKKTLTNINEIEENVNNIFTQIDSVGFKYHKYLGHLKHIIGNAGDAKIHFKKSDLIRESLLNNIYFGNERIVIIGSDTCSSVGMLSHLDTFIIDNKINNREIIFYIINNESFISNKYFMNLYSENINFISREKLISYLNKKSFISNNFLIDLLTVNWHWNISESNFNLFIHDFINLTYTENLKTSNLFKGINSNYISSKINLIDFYSFFKVDKESKFCCIHIRTFKYNLGKESRSNESFRTPHLSQYILLIEQLLVENYIVVIMGDLIDEELIDSFNNCKFIENLLFYSNSKIKSDYLDIELISNCDLFITTPSGLYGVASVFNKRIFLVDYPLYKGLPWRVGQYILPVRYFNRDELKYIDKHDFNKIEFLTHGFSLIKNGFEVHFNDKIDILNGYIEFKNAVANQINDAVLHIEYKSISKNLNSRIGKSRKLDVLIPTRNRPQKLFELLKSGLDLCYSDITFCVFDDGSIETNFIEGVGVLSTYQVCSYFDSDQIIYKSSSLSIGLGGHWEQYFSSGDVSDYIMAIPDKDRFISCESLLQAINLIENDDDIALVIAPLQQIDRSENMSIFKINYKKMNDTSFYNLYVNDNSLQHCSMWGLFRTKFVLDKHLPNSLKLREFGLDDAFGIDLDFVMNIVMDKKIDFISTPIIRRSTILGATERYPLTFAYTYYQYALIIFKKLYQKNKLSKESYKNYLLWWNILILRGLNVSLNHVHGSELEVGIERISKHLKFNIHLYLFYQLFIHRLRPNNEYLLLFFHTLKISLLNVFLGFSKLTSKLFLISILNKFIFKYFYK